MVLASLVNHIPIKTQLLRRNTKQLFLKYASNYLPHYIAHPRRPTLCRQIIRLNGKNYSTLKYRLITNPPLSLSLSLSLSHTHTHTHLQCHLNLTLKKCGHVGLCACWRRKHQWHFTLPEFGHLSIALRMQDCGYINLNKLLHKHL